jgi:hypothetical protein
MYDVWALGLWVKHGERCIYKDMGTSLWGARPPRLRLVSMIEQSLEIAAAKEKEQNVW